MRASIMLGHATALPVSWFHSILFFHASCHPSSPCTARCTTDEMQPRGLGVSA